MDLSDPDFRNERNSVSPPGNVAKGWPVFTTAYKGRATLPNWFCCIACCFSYTPLPSVYKRTRTYFASSFFIGGRVNMFTSIQRRRSRHHDRSGSSSEESFTP